jgi:hypothetical protein
MKIWGMFLTKGWGNERNLNFSSIELLQACRISLGPVTTFSRTLRYLNCLELCLLSSFYSFTFDLTINNSSPFSENPHLKFLV